MNPWSDGHSKKMTVKERFWSKVEKLPDDGCWVWHGMCKRHGYGQFYVSRERRVVIASRFALELVGRDPGNLFACHSCDNPSCVRPDHLFIGTHEDNIRDSWNKGRGIHPVLRGEEHGRAKLTRTDVGNIRAAYATGESLHSITLRYAVNKPAIWKVIRGITWREDAA